MRASPDRIEALRRRLARIEDRQPVNADRFLLGHEGADRALGGLSRRGLHEVYPATSMDMASADGFALGLAARAAGGGFVVWIAQSMTTQESGLPYGEGLKAWGLDPGRMLFVRVRDAKAMLAAGEDALKSRAASVVVMSAWGRSKALGLTAERRLSLAAREGATAILLRAAAMPSPGTAETRWEVRSAASRPLEAGAPGRPTLGARLVRNRIGASEMEWIMEWDGDARRFDSLAPVSGGMVPLPADRPAREGGQVVGIRRPGLASGHGRQGQRRASALRH